MSRGGFHRTVNFRYDVNVISVFMLYRFNVILGKLLKITYCPFIATTYFSKLRIICVFFSQIVISLALKAKLLQQTWTLHRPQALTELLLAHAACQACKGDLHLWIGKGMKTMTWTDEGRVDLGKSVLFEAPKVLRVRRRSFRWTGEPVLSPSEFHICRHWSVHVVGNVLSITRLRSKIGLDNATDQLEI